MATEDFIPKNNTTPEGGWQRSVDTREYVLTRGEAVKMIADLAKMLALPGGTLAAFSVDDHGTEVCRVILVLVEKDKDPTLRY